MAAFSCNVCGQGFDFGDCSCDSLPDPPRGLPGKEALALAFVRFLRETLGQDVYDTVVDLNSRELNPDVCHSGDFCDSNMVMDAAFGEFGIDPSTYGRVDEDDGMPQEVCDLWNSAWDRAKEIMQEGRAL
ncbi:hypothetical protein AXL1_21 [Stenotrophomonas phage vB_SmaS-AXL_1]|uniref:hypothetical protein n=1 Tax=Stenotrophomonas phage vB_SmaS-AXL_1 TaxID=2909581 RepID=UPI00240953F1|nr:hypothetical protein P9A52_gp21 [Stenotrophomonas phage vB_SmaS-AXL_1]UIS24778.1 hypothetical protein AXL1_21 [Stenotrophomonas phage vB_SmaS-AXL_1]